MKKCSKCQLKKHKSKFHSNKSKMDGLQGICKVCQNAYTKNHYNRNKPYYKTKAKKNRKISKVKAYKFLREYCKSHPCKCGEKDFVVLDFNHKDRSKKIDNISSMVSSGRPFEEIKKELKKCEVMCSNCHRRHTAKQMNWYKSLTSP